jgi:hypothetical protein
MLSVMQSREFSFGFGLTIQELSAINLQREGKKCAEEESVTSLFGNTNKKKLYKSPLIRKLEMVLEKRFIGSTCTCASSLRIASTASNMSAKTEAGTSTLASSLIIQVGTPTLNQMDSPSANCHWAGEGNKNLYKPAS